MDGPVLKGTLWRVSNSVAIAGVQTDAGAMVATVRKADNTTTTPAVVHDGTGLYHSDIDTTSGPQGVWQVLWSGTAPAQTVAEYEFWVEDPALS